MDRKKKVEVFVDGNYKVRVFGRKDKNEGYVGGGGTLSKDGDEFKSDEVLGGANLCTDGGVTSQGCGGNKIQVSSFQDHQVRVISQLTDQKVTGSGGIDSAILENGGQSGS